MDRLNEWLKRILPSWQPEAVKALHDQLGWALTVLLPIAGLLTMMADPMTGWTCIALAIAVCPKVEAPAPVRVGFILIALFILSDHEHPPF